MEIDPYNLPDNHVENSSLTSSSFSASGSVAGHELKTAPCMKAGRSLRREGALLPIGVEENLA
jgi:hypothetical protein